MTKADDYRATLRDLPTADWAPYLLAHSNLPGPRGNLELAAAVADAGTEAQFRRWASLGPDVAPENTPECFLAFCGVVGLGAIMARRGGFSRATSGRPSPADSSLKTIGASTAGNPLLVSLQGSGREIGPAPGCENPLRR